MKVTQKNVRVFHIVIDDEATFLEYFRKNSILLKEFFLLIEGSISKSIAFVLDQNGICYKDMNGFAIRMGGIKQETPLPIEQEREKIEEKAEILKPNLKSKLYDRPIRSGEEIHEHCPVVIFGRVNSGAKVFCEESISVYGVIDGLVQCDGEYALISGGISPRGNLIFNGEIIDKTKVKPNVLHKIVLKENGIEIKEVM